LDILIYLPFLLIIFSSCRNETIKASLKITIELQNKYNPAHPDLYKLTIHKDGKHFKEFIPGKYLPAIARKIKLDSLSTGTYELKYENFFGQKISKTLLINASKVYHIQLYPDSIDVRKSIEKTFLNRIENSDSLKIKYVSRGCFHTDKDSLVIQKLDKILYLSYHNKKIKLNGEQAAYLLKFESELHEIPENGGCTTSDSYQIGFQNEHTNIIDSGCAWNGWISLKRKFKL
jgi:hypothetical protein